MSQADAELEQLFAGHLEGLYRYALHLTHGRAADAEDLVQDTVLRALRHAGQLRDPAAGRAWLFRILTTTHLNTVRASRRRAEEFAADLDERRFEEALADWTPLTTVEEQVLRSIEWTDLQVHLDRLDPELRTTVWLVDVEGHGHREVAEMLGIAEGTVASRIFRARRRLRTSLLAAREPAAHAVGGIHGPA